MEHPLKSKEIFSQYEKLLADLAQNGVEFAVVGGLAVVLNGYLRSTLDADILVQKSPENLKKLLDCLKNWGEGWAKELKPEDFNHEEGCVRVSEEFDLDIFTRMRERTWADFRSRLRFLETSVSRIPYLSPADLIFLKQGSWRDKDKLDVQAMKEVIAQEEKNSKT